jgi:glycerate 2-kinase
VTQFSTFSSLLRQSLQAGLAAVAGERVVAAKLRTLPKFFSGSEPVWAVALGKAAPAMLRGAAEVLGARIQAALVVTRADCWDAREADFPFPVEAHFGGHPQITAASLAAGEALIRFLDRVSEEGRVLFLISGGASALVELPRPGVTLEDFRRLTDEAFAAGWGIAQLNAIRARFSQLKGGGLWRFCQGRDVTELLISDVPEDDPEVIASGLLHPTSDKNKDTQLVDSHLPEWIRKVLMKESQPTVYEIKVSEKFDSFVVASNAALRMALMENFRASLRLKGPQFLPTAATSAALEIEDGGLLPDGLEPALACIDAEVRAHHSHKKIRVKIWGGEVPIPLPEVPGCGGRARHFALAVAQRLAGVSGWQLLVAATDGSDGSDLQAGALVDGATAARAASAGLSIEAALGAADSGSLLADIGQDFATGPTGTNVMDVFVLLCGSVEALSRMSSSRMT